METGEEEVVGWDFVVRLRPAQEAPRGSRSRAPGTSHFLRTGWVGSWFWVWPGDRLGGDETLVCRDSRGARSESLGGGPLERDSQGSALPWSWPVAPIVGVNI